MTGKKSLKLRLSRIFAPNARSIIKRTINFTRFFLRTINPRKSLEVYWIGGATRDQQFSQ